MTPQKEKREAVLVIVHPDGWIEVYAEKRFDVRIEMFPQMDTPEGDIAAEEYVDSCLPQRHRDVYWPGLRRAIAMSEQVRPEDIACREYELQLLRAIQGGAI